MKAYLVLENGQVFCGERYGAEGDVVGELVFTTGMGAYVETLTDNAYCGQIVMQTFPLIGNYGMISEDYLSDKSYVTAYISREKCDTPSNFRCEKTLDEYLKEQGIIGLYNVDTREITRVIRENGVMNAKITSEAPDGVPSDVKEYSIKDAVKTVCENSEKKNYTVEDAKYNVAVLNLGAMADIVPELMYKNCNVTVLPYNASADEMMNYDGIVISGGPGNPEENVEIINNVKELFGKKPIFGISLGHQILALAAGGKTEKLKYGHRGANQPVKCAETEKVYITGQNHGYVVNMDSLPEFSKVIFTNVNDGTCEGIEYDGKNAFSVQFATDAFSGPNRSNILYDKFLSMMGVK